MSGCCFPGRCWVADRVLLTLFLHTMSLCGGPCAAVPGPLFYFLISFTASKGFFLFQSFSFSFTPEPLQLRHKRNLPAAAFVLAFQEAEEQCESFLISLWTNEIVRQARSSGGKPTAQVVRRGGGGSLIKAQQNQLKKWYFPLYRCLLKIPCKCWHMHRLSDGASAYASEQEAQFGALNCRNPGL